MKIQLLKNSSVLVVVILFSLISGVALAEKKHWFVVKDKDGACRVIEAVKVVEPFKTIAGPYKTMRAAEKRKAKVCPERAGQDIEQLNPSQEQAEPMRRQHQQLEETRQQHLRQQQTPHQQKEQAEPARRQHQQRDQARQQQLKQKQAPQQDQQTEKIKGEVQEKIQRVKSSEEKVKEKTKEPIPSDRKN